MSSPPKNRCGPSCMSESRRSSAGRALLLAARLSRRASRVSGQTFRSIGWAPVESVRLPRAAAYSVRRRIADRAFEVSPLPRGRVTPKQSWNRSQRTVRWTEAITIRPCCSSAISRGGYGLGTSARTAPAARTLRPTADCWQSNSATSWRSLRPRQSARHSRQGKADPVGDRWSPRVAAWQLPTPRHRAAAPLRRCATRINVRFEM